MIINHKNYLHRVLGLAWTLVQSREVSKNEELWELSFSAHELKLENCRKLSLLILLAVSWGLEPRVQRGLGIGVRVCVCVILLFLKFCPKTQIPLVFAFASGICVLAKSENRNIELS